MTSRHAFALATVLGLVALLLGWVIVSQGHKDDAIPAVSSKATYIDADAMLHLAEVLSSDALEGRASGTPGNQAARGFIRKRFEEVGVVPYFDSGWEQAVAILPSAENANPGPGANLVGWVPGQTPRSGPFILITAHFDHLGVRDGQIYNGADDNASGAAALIAIAAHFVRHPPVHDLVFAALDGEEIGFLGARTLARDEAFDLYRAALNINLDMISRSEAGELHVAGTYHTPALADLVTRIGSKAPVQLLLGHDRPEDGPHDWTNNSDHAVFHAAGLPFLYFGVEDHPDYHQPTDEFSAITPDFYVRTADTLVMVIRAADTILPDIAALRRTPNETAQPEGPAE